MNYLEQLEITDEVLKSMKELIMETAHGKQRHEYYKESCEIAEKCEAFTTGEDIEQYLHQFNRRETAEMFEQRKLITQEIVPAIISNLTFVLNKIPRSPAIKLAYLNTDKTKDANLKQVEGKYYAKNTVENMIAQKQKLWDSNDPNTWRIEEFKGTDGSTLAQPYPFIVEAEDALNYEYINGNLNYLIVQTEEVLKYIDGSNKVAKECYNYTIYTPNQNITFRAVYNPVIAGLMDNGQFKIVPEIRDGLDVINEYAKINDILYQVVVPLPHNIGWVQARRVGYKLYDECDGAPFVPFWWEAEPYLMKLIKVNSEMDLTMALHAFPQKLQYTKCCQSPNCNHGQLIEGGTCQTCKGTGLMPHTSAQDIIEITLPTSKEEMIDLNTLIAYIYPPVDGLTFQKEYIIYLVNEAQKTVFNSDVFSKKEISDTATGKMLDYQAVYDTIYPYARNYADSWEFSIKTIAKITDTFEGLEVVAVVEKDFRFKTLAELMADLQVAKLAGANETILRNIQNEIIAVMYSERPSDVMKYQVKEMFDPFSGKSPEEKIYLLSSPNVSKKVKVLSANFGVIFDELEMEYPDFYEWEKSKQKQEIDKKITEIMADVEVVRPTIQFGNEITE